MERVRCCDVHHMLIVTCCQSANFQLGSASMLMPFKKKEGVPLTVLSKHSQWDTPQGANMSHLTPHTSHLIPHTSHITHHTSHITPHTTHLKLHTSHLTLHIAHVTPRTPHTARHTSHATREWPPAAPVLPRHTRCRVCISAVHSGEKVRD